MSHPKNKNRVLGGKKGTMWENKQTKKSLFTVN